MSANEIIRKNVQESATGWKAITKSDTVTLKDGIGRWPSQILVQGAGDIAMKSEDGDVITYTAVANEVILFRPKYVMATDTTATNIWGLY